MYIFVIKVKDSSYTEDNIFKNIAGFKFKLLHFVLHISHSLSIFMVLRNILEYF